MTEGPLDSSKFDIHRMGGATIDNLRLKPREATLDVPGISVLKASTPVAAARLLRSAFPKAKRLCEEARVVGSTTEELVRSAGFDIVAAPTVTLPDHYRIIHPDGAKGFSDENLARLVLVFVNTTGN